MEYFEFDDYVPTPTPSEVADDLRLYVKSQLTTLEWVLMKLVELTPEDTKTRDRAAAVASNGRSAIAIVREIINDQAFSARNEA